MTKQRACKVDEVTDALRADILHLTLAPGTVLSPAALRARFGTSSTPIRDALLRLEQEKLVAILPRARTIVTRIDLEDAFRAHVLRRALDAEAGRILLSAARAEDLAQLEAILDRQAAHLDLASREAFDRLDTEFHLAQYRLAGIEELWHMTQARSGHINRIRRLNLFGRGKAEQVLEDHRVILDALRRGDAAALSDAIYQHLTRSAPLLGRMAEAFPEYFAPPPA